MSITLLFSQLLCSVYTNGTFSRGDWIVVVRVFVLLSHLQAQLQSLGSVGQSQVPAFQGCQAAPPTPHTAKMLQVLHSPGNAT